MQAIVGALTLYPLKGAAGIPLDAAEVRTTGLALDGVADREWMAVDADGVFVTQRERPRLALVRTSIDGGRLVLSTDRRDAIALDARGPSRPVTVWSAHVRGHDAGDDAAAWLSDAIGADVRVVRFDASHPRRCNPAYAGDSGAHVRFADGYPLLVIGRASLDHLNERLVAKGERALPMNRFRPNIVLDGIEAFDEDYIDQLSIGNAARLQVVKPCVRCTVPNVDPMTGDVGLEPGATLAAYRTRVDAGGTTFGVNAIVAAGAGSQLSVHDPVEVKLTF